MNKLHAALIAGLLVTTAFAQAAMPTAGVNAATSTSVAATPDVKVPHAVVAADANAKAKASESKGDAKATTKKAHHISHDAKVKTNASDVNANAGASASVK